MSAPHCQGAIKVGTYVGKKEEILGYYYYVISNIALLYSIYQLRGVVCHLWRRPCSVHCDCELSEPTKNTPSTTAAKLKMISHTLVHLAEPTLHILISQGVWPKAGLALAMSLTSC